MSGAERLTFLRGPGVLGAKRFTPTGPLDYETGKGPFSVVSLPVSSLEETVDILRQCPSDAFLIRGKTLIPDATTIERRTKKPGTDKHTSLRYEAYLAEESHCLLPIDYDGKEDGLDPLDVASVASAVRSFLPEQFHAAQCFACATSSAGIKPGGRARLFFWLSRPISDDEARAWLAPYAPQIDTSIYSPIQPIYVCAPSFDGVADPFADKSRWVELPGNSVVEAPTQFEIPEGKGFSFKPSSALPTEGNRHKYFLSEAGYLRRRGHSAEQIYTMLSAVNQNVLPPYPDEELRSLCESVGTYEPEAIPSPAKPVKAAKVKAALRDQAQRIAQDPSLLDSALVHLAPHVASGALTVGQVATVVSKALDLAETKTPISRADLVAKIEHAPALAEDTRPHWAEQCLLGDDSEIVTTPENLGIILEQHPQVSVWLDDRFQQEFWQACPWRDPGPVISTDGFALRRWLSREFGWHKLPQMEPLEAVAESARKRLYDPWWAYLDSLDWDGTDRLLGAATAIFGAEPTPATQMMFAWWLISAVARSYQPGCQVDHTLVLIGGQGIGKTSALRALAVHPKYFTRLVTSGELSSVRVVGKIHGPVIVELAEFAALGRRDVEQTKAFLDETEDRVQWLYARKQSNVPRKCVFAATTNDLECLRDQTGNRRFWPIVCGDNVDLAWVTEHRDQLWAEAVSLYKQGEQWWPTRQEAVDLGLALIQERFRERPALESIVEEILEIRFSPGIQSRFGGVPLSPDQLDAEGRLIWATVSQLIEIGRLDRKHDQKALTQALRVLKWSSKRERLDGSQQRIWTALDSRERGRWTEKRSN